MADLTATTRKVPRQPLAFGMQKWGPLPDTDHLFLVWDGPGGHVYLTDDRKPAVAGLPVRHPSLRGTFDSLRDVERGVSEFVAAYEADKASDPAEYQPDEDDL